MGSLRLGRFVKGKELELAMSREGTAVTGTVWNADATKVLARLRVRLPTEDRSALFINSFYVYGRTTPTEFTDEEKTAGKGLGKLMLCALISHLKLKDGTPVDLEASGGAVPPGYTSGASEAEIDAFLAKYPRVVRDLEHDARVAKLPAPSLAMKETAYGSILENQRLLRYYQGYGFTVVGEDEGYSARMRSTVGHILSTCGKAGGDRKTRRGKRRLTTSTGTSLRRRYRRPRAR